MHPSYLKGPLPIVIGQAMLALVRQYLCGFIIGAVLPCGCGTVTVHVMRVFYYLSWAILLVVGCVHVYAYSLALGD